MDLNKEVQRLPRRDKIKLMETIWTDLTRDTPTFESPSWHQDELQRTEERLNAGEEEVVDWSEAKKRLRKMVK